MSNEVIKWSECHGYSGGLCYDVNTMEILNENLKSIIEEVYNPFRLKVQLEFHSPYFSETMVFNASSPFINSLDDEKQLKEYIYNAVYDRLNCFAKKVDGFISGDDSLQKPPLPDHIFDEYKRFIHRVSKFEYNDRIRELTGRIFTIIALLVSTNKGDAERDNEYVPSFMPYKLIDVGASAITMGVSIVDIYDCDDNGKTKCTRYKTDYRTIDLEPEYPLVETINESLLRMMNTEMNAIRNPSLLDIDTRPVQG